MAVFASFHADNGLRSARGGVGAAAFLLLAAGLACAATPGRAEDRCSGTLCDLYYGSSSDAAKTAPAGTATAVTVPQTGFLGRLFGAGKSANAPAPSSAPAAAPASATAQPAAASGGRLPGILGAFSGAPTDRCTGTLCDLYYGGSPDEKPGPQPTAATPVATDGAVAADDDAPAPRSGRHRSADAAVDRPACAATAADPWHCLR